MNRPSLFSLLLILYYINFFLLFSAVGDQVVLNIDRETDSRLLAEQTCINRYKNCFQLAHPSIDYFLYRNFDRPLDGWQDNEICQCKLPPRPELLDSIQFLHIPKTGTSINFYFHDYYNCSQGYSNPCPSHLTNSDDLVQGLCGKRLFTCAGHRVTSDLPELSLMQLTNMFTMLRHPWNRLQSDFHYLRGKPHSGHLGPEINTTDLLLSSNSVLEYARYPGMANCATKMLNGIQCCDSSTFLTDEHLEIAKEVLVSMLGFGITEYFKSSVCLFSWMYGGSLPPHTQQFTRTRTGDYLYQSYESFGILDPEGKKEFEWIERFDLALYAFGLEIFLQRKNLTGCPIVD